MKGYEPRKEDWEKSKLDNEILIVNNLMQIEMAKKIIKLAEQKIKSFPDEYEKCINTSQPEELVDSPEESLKI